MAAVPSSWPSLADPDGRPQATSKTAAAPQAVGHDDETADK